MSALDRDRGMQHAITVACGMLGTRDAASVRGAMAACRSSESIALADSAARIADLPLDGPSR